MKAFPKITVVTPSFNQARFIEATIQSVLSQRYPNLQYIIMDGGSTDGSVEIIQRYAAFLDHWQSAPDGGQTDALIAGFERATGDILCWLCSDDLLAPNALHEVASHFNDNPETEVVYGDAYWIGPNDERLRAKREHAFSKFIWLNHENFVPQPSTFWRRELYDKVGGLNRAFDLAMDADLWIRFAEHTDLVHVPRTWSFMRNYPEQKNRRLRHLSDIEDRMIRNRYLNAEPSLGRFVKKACARTLRISRKLAGGCYWGGTPIALPLRDDHGCTP